MRIFMQEMATTIVAYHFGFFRTCEVLKAGLHQKGVGDMHFADTIAALHREGVGELHLAERKLGKTAFKASLPQHSRTRRQTLRIRSLPCSSYKFGADCYVRLNANAHCQMYTCCTAYSDPRSRHILASDTFGHHKCAYQHLMVFKMKGTTAILLDLLSRCETLPLDLSGWRFLGVELETGSPDCEARCVSTVQFRGHRSEIAIVFFV